MSNSPKPSRTVVSDPHTPWIASQWRPESEDGQDCYSFLRVPFDLAVSHRAGCRLGPDAVLEAFNRLSGYCVDYRTDFSSAVFVDRGDVEVFNSIEATHQAIEQAVTEIGAGQLPIVIGGDHSITEPVIRGLNRRLGGTVSLVVFDAHLDSRETIPGKMHSGNWMFRLRGENQLAKSAQLGISAPIYGPAHIADAESKGTVVFTISEMRRLGVPATIERVLEHVGGNAVPMHVSIDIDCLDSAFAPGTSVPAPIGFRPDELTDALFQLGSEANVVGLDVVEVSPPLDPSGRTAELAALLLTYFLAGRANRAQSKPIKLRS